MPVDRLADPVDVLVELPGQATLADARLADHRHEPQASLTRGRVEHLLDKSQLRLAAHERWLEDVRTARPTDHANDADRSPRRHRRGLALEQLVAGRFEGDRLARRAVRGFADEHGAGRRHRLQARCGIDEVAGDHPLAHRPQGHGRFAGEDPGADLEGSPGDREATDRLDQLEPGTDRTLGVILVRGRRSPHGHDGVTDEFLDRPAVTPDDVGSDLEVPGQQLADRLRIAILGQRREADQIREEDGHHPPFGGARVGDGICADGRQARGHRLRIADGRAALAAEPVRRRVGRATGGARRDEATAAGRTELASWFVGRPTRPTVQCATLSHAVSDPVRSLLGPLGSGKADH